MKTTTLLALAAGAAAQSTIKFGPYYSLGKTNSYTVESDTTLYPGKTPSPQQNRMVLWPGMGTDANDLVLCGVASGQWCIFASVLQDNQQLSGPAVPMNANQGVRIQYKYDASTQKISQTVSVEGKVVSAISSTGKAIGWGTAVECQDACSGIFNAHKYSNTTITLASADTAFAKTLAINEADATSLTTSDGGKTWHVDTINIHQHSF